MELESKFLASLRVKTQFHAGSVTGVHSGVTFPVLRCLCTNALTIPSRMQAKSLSYVDGNQHLISCVGLARTV